MTVAQLLKRLKGVDPKALIVMSSDGEGNSFSPLSEAADGLYLAESEWSGELWSPDNEDQEETPPKKAKKVIVLWPAG